MGDDVGVVGEACDVEKYSACRVHMIPCYKRRSRALQ